jgi:hypothetical protein
VHIAGPSEGGWYVTEVWESKRDFARFVPKKKPPRSFLPMRRNPHIEEFEVYSRQTKDQMIA